MDVLETSCPVFSLSFFRKEPIRGEGRGRKRVRPKLTALAESLQQRGPELFTGLRETYIWAEHRDGAPDKVWPEVDGEAVVRLGETLTKKTAGFAVGRRLAKDDPKVAAREPLLEEVEATVLDLFPIYAAAAEAGTSAAGRPAGR